MQQETRRKPWRGANARNAVTRNASPWQRVWKRCGEGMSEESRDPAGHCMPMGNTQRLTFNAQPLTLNRTGNAGFGSFLGFWATNIRRTFVAILKKPEIPDSAHFSAFNILRNMLIFSLLRDVVGESKELLRLARVRFV